MKKSRRNRKNNNQTKVHETKIVQTVNNEVPVTEEDLALKNAVISNIENSDVEEKKDETTQPKSNTTNGLLDSLTKKVNSIVEETVKSNKTEKPVETKAPAVEPIMVKCDYNRDNCKLSVYTVGEPFVLSLQALSDEYSSMGRTLPEAEFRGMAIYMENLFLNIIPKFINPCGVIPFNQFGDLWTDRTLLMDPEFRCFYDETFDSNYVVYKFAPHAIDNFMAFVSDANDGNLLFPLVSELAKLLEISSIDKMKSWLKRKPSDSDRALQESTAILMVELDEAFKKSEYSLSEDGLTALHKGRPVSDEYALCMSTVSVEQLGTFISLNKFMDACGMSLEYGEDGSVRIFEDSEEDEDFENDDDEDEDSDDEFSIEDTLDDDEDDDFEDDEDDEDVDEDEDPEDESDDDDDYNTVDENTTELAEDDSDEELDVFQEYYEKVLSLLSKLSRCLQKYYDPEKLNKVFSADISTDSATVMAILAELGLNIKADKNINLDISLSSYYDEKSTFRANLKMADYIVSYWSDNMGDFVDRADEMDLDIVDDVTTMIANSVYTLLAYGLVNTRDMITLNTLMSAVSASDEDDIIKLEKIRNKVEIVLEQRAKLSASISKASDPSVMTLLAQLSCYISTPSEKVFDPPTNERFEFDDPKSVKRYCVSFGEYLQSKGCEIESMYTAFIDHADVLKFGNEGIYGLAAIKFLAWMYDESRLNRLVSRYF